MAACRYHCIALVSPILAACVCVQVFEPAFREPFPNVTRWFLTCVNQPEFLAELGEVQLCSKAAQFDGTGGMGVGVGEGGGEDI